MTARRFFTDKIENVTVLTGEEFRHAANVLRVKKGDEVRLVFPLPVLSVRSVEDGAARRGRVALTRGPLTYVAAKPGAGLHLSDSVPPQPDYTINYTGFVPLAGRLDPDTPQAGSSATAGVALKAVPYAYASQLLKGRLTLWLPERS